MQSSNTITMNYMEADQTVYTVGDFKMRSQEAETSSYSWYNRGSWFGVPALIVLSINLHDPVSMLDIPLVFKKCYHS